MRAQPLDRQLVRAQRGGTVRQGLAQPGDALLDRFERCLRRLLVQLAQARLGAGDLGVPYCAAGNEIASGVARSLRPAARACSSWRLPARAAQRPPCAARSCRAAVA
jgi:hypothetical protein